MLTAFRSLLFKRATPRLNLFPKISFVKMNNFLSQPKRSFSEEITLNLNQQEAYLWNEHDRMIVQLNSNVVPMTSMPKFMKELLEICVVLNKYKEYMKGWIYISKFFHENLKNFSNEELTIYIAAIALNSYPPEISNFFADVTKEVLSRNLDKEYILQLMSSVLLCDSFGEEFWNGMVRKLEGYNNLKYEENIRLAALLGESPVKETDPIWETLLSKLENLNVVKGEPLTYYLRAAQALKSRVQRDSPFYSNILAFVEQNIQSLPADYVCHYIDILTRIKSNSVSDLVEIIAQTFPIVKDATDYGKFEFYRTVFNLCLENPSLTTALEVSKNKIGENFFVPSQKFMNEYSSYVSQINSYTENALEKAHEQFWSTHAQVIGLRQSQAVDFSVHGFTSYETMNAVTKNINRE